MLQECCEPVFFSVRSYIAPNHDPRILHYFFKIVRLHECFAKYHLVIVMQAPLHYCATHKVALRQ